MCRLYGFRSIIPSQVHRSLLSADNALGTQSSRHPDGWGVAFYVDGAPHVTKSPQTAHSDQLFHRLSGVVAAETVLAHVRKATQGSLHVLNCHPFQFGRFTFAHNGDIPSFAAHRPTLVESIHPRLRRYVLGDTDSEVCFFLFLSLLEKRGALRDAVPYEALEASLREMVALVRSVADDGSASPSLLTFLVTDGVSMAAHMGGKELFYSTYKRRCADRDTCASLSPACEAATVDGRVNHFLVSSEPVLGENVWLPVPEGTVVGVDGAMTLRLSSDGRTRLPLAPADPHP